MTTLAHWRSLLYVPGNNPRFLTKAQDRGADALILDLEDSVLDDQKDAARACLVDWFPRLVEGPSALTLRINGSLRLAVRDLEALVLPGLQAVVVPKCERAGKAALLAEVIGELEAERGLAVGGIAIIALIESPSGVAEAYSIARAHPRVQALLLGSEDFAAACCMIPSSDNLRGAKRQIVYAARAAGISPLGLLESVAVLDPTKIEGFAREARAFGFSGSTVVHPALVDALNEGFSPSKDEISWAQSVLEELSLAQAKGSGAARLDGQMLDKPVLARAKSILMRRGNTANRR